MPERRQEDIILKRILAKTRVNRNIIYKGAPCIEFTGAARGIGYPIIWDGEKMVAVHRYIWEVAHQKPVPEGHVVHHGCHNRACIRNGHMQLMTIAEHIQYHIENGDFPQLGSVPNLSLRKLTPGEVMEIRLLHGILSTRELADDYGVDSKTIWDIVNHNTYRDVT